MSKVDDLERKTRHQQEQIYELKEQATHLQSELTLKGAQFDGDSMFYLLISKIYLSVPCVCMQVILIIDFLGCSWAMSQSHSTAGKATVACPTFVLASLMC